MGIHENHSSVFRKTLRNWFWRSRRALGGADQETVELNVHLARDAETGIWFIAASDIPGMRLEAPSVHELIEKVQDVAPDLLELNSAEVIAGHYSRKSVRKNLKPLVNIRPVIDTPLAVPCG